MTWANARNLRNPVTATIISTNDSISHIFIIQKRINTWTQTILFEMEPPFEQTPLFPTFHSNKFLFLASMNLPLVIEVADELSQVKWRDKRDQCFFFFCWKIVTVTPFHQCYSIHSYFCIVFSIMFLEVGKSVFKSGESGCLLSSITSRCFSWRWMLVQFRRRHRNIARKTPKTQNENVKKLNVNLSSKNTAVFLLFLFCF
jgi:hypothetical protein